MFAVAQTCFVSTNYARDAAHCLREPEAFSKELDLSGFEIPEPDKRFDENFIALD